MLPLARGSIRCERRAGQLVREGQANREIAVRSDNRHTLRDERGHLVSPKDVVGAKRSSDLVPLYGLADAPDEEFEEVAYGLVLVLKAASEGPPPRWERFWRHWRQESQGKSHSDFPPSGG